MKKNIIIFGGLLLLFLSPTNSTADTTPYGYPIKDPYAATVVGTPPKYQANLPKNIRLKTMKLDVFKNRTIPDIFWYDEKFEYSLAYQKKKAPLIFIIAGTGASYQSSKMLILQKAFFKAGFHVVSISSPTYENFIITASNTHVPGNIADDAKDLYHLMELIRNQIKHFIKISEFYLTGYSLGGFQAAFVTRLDEKKGSFNFNKVLMINPPVSMYNSVEILDKMLINNIPKGPDGLNDLYEELLHKFIKFYKHTNHVYLDRNFLYSAYKEIRPDNSNLAALVGVSFRFSSTNMIFTSDVMSNAGFIVPKNTVLSPYDSLTDYFKVTLQVSFMDYFDKLLYPYLKSKNPDCTKQEVIDLMSLKSIENYLIATKKISLVTNADDLILLPGDISYLSEVFGDRAKIYPWGGHCGNIGYKSNIEYMINYFQIKDNRHGE
ncbi:MAG: alpha/beta hydrolase [Desulfobacteraceae bacterium 4572_19]|nr:MAG: alpha/beta hydrolase [Desulfobacteraceae bacterium 4572_19]